MKRKRYPESFKAKVVAEYKAGKSSLDLGRIYEINPNVITRWVREQRIEQSETPEVKHLKKRIAELERMVGRLAMEKEILEGAKIFLTRGGK